MRNFVKFLGAERIQLLNTMVSLNDMQHDSVGRLPLDNVTNENVRRAIRDDDFTRLMFALDSIRFYSSVYQSFTNNYDRMCRVLLPLYDGSLVYMINDIATIHLLNGKHQAEQIIANKLGALSGLITSDWEGQSFYDKVRDLLDSVEDTTEPVEETPQEDEVQYTELCLRVDNDVVYQFCRDMGIARHPERVGYINDWLCQQER